MTQHPLPSEPKTVTLISPRGFCAGVDRAIKIVEQALIRYGKPVYVRHEIVHNRRVVETLEAQGAIFVDELDVVPADRPVVFSAHGVAKTVYAEAEERALTYLDATCPLVSKVHIEAQRHAAEGRHIFLIGHAGHPEVIGTLGQIERAQITLVEDEEDARTVMPPAKQKLAYVTQTTLSVDDTAAIIDILKTRFPDIAAPHKEDICYATTNRQQAVKAVANTVDVMLVIGAENSSNSQRLVEVAQRAGCPEAQLIADAHELHWEMLDGARHIGITAGASAPESVTQEIVAALQQRYSLHLVNYEDAVENVTFNLPRELRD